MNGKITRESAAGQRLIFHPQSEDESTFLQERLFGLGFAWANGEKRVQNTMDCVRNGLVLIDNVIYWRNPTDTAAYTACSVGQVAADYLTPDQRLMTELFNKLSARIDVLSEKVDRIYKELYPDVSETKPGLRRKP